MNSDPAEELMAEVRELRARVARLEDALYQQRILSERWNEQAPVATSAAEDSAKVPAVPSRPASAIAPPRTPAAPPEPPAAPASFRLFESSAAANVQTLENRIGSQWFNRIGILALLIATAWFLKMAIDNHWIGPLGRVLIGLLSGAALVGWSERFRIRGYVLFGYSLKALGSGVLYLSLWAAWSLYHLIPSPLAFAAMILVTAFNGLLAWKQDAELLALYAIAGGMSTPALVSAGENHEIALFTYILLLDLAVLALVMLRPWSRLLVVAFIGTLVYGFGWAFEYYTPEQFAPTATFTAVFFLLFSLAPRLVRLTTEGEDVSPWDHLATIVLPLATAAVGFLSFYFLLDTSQDEWMQPWLAVAFAAFYLLLLRLPTRGRWRPASGLLPHLHLACAVVFLTIAIPMKASGRWITIGWLTEGTALVWVATRAHSLLLRALALLCLVLGLVALVTVNPPAAHVLLLNQRFAGYAVAIAALAVVSWLAARTGEEEDCHAALQWRSVAAAGVLLINLLALAAASLEIHDFWWWQHWHGEPGMYSRYAIYAQFSYSALCMLYGAALLAVGIARHSAYLRWQALVLLAVSIGKVFLVDTSALSEGYRIFSFLGLGALLLAVSFVYQRDLLHLRAHEENAP